MSFVINPGLILRPFFPSSCNAPRQITPFLDLRSLIVSFTSINWFILIVFCLLSTFKFLLSFLISPAFSETQLGCKTRVGCVVLCVSNTPQYKLHKYRIISSTSFNAQFNNNMYVTLPSSTCFGP